MLSNYKVSAGFYQGRADALWALLRRQYDRVSVMRPASADKVRPKPPPCFLSNIISIIAKTPNVFMYYCSCESLAPGLCISLGMQYVWLYVPRSTTYSVMYQNDVLNST